MKPVTSFRAYDPSFIFAPFLGNGGSRNPQLADFDPTFGLIFRSMLEPKKLRRAADMVVVQVRKRHHVAIVRSQPVAQMLWKVAPFVVRIVCAT